VRCPTFSEADTLACLGLIELRQGRYDQAAARLQHTLARCDATGDLSSRAGALDGPGEQARAHHRLARAYHDHGDPARAGRHWGQALTLYAEFGAAEADQIRAQLAAGQPAPTAR
jgi:Tfp pilus assembly protein PilF